jgi:hypothetical protein
MARSIHTTSKDRQIERRFARTDGDVPNPDAITFLEREGLKKSVYKLNAAWKKKAKTKGAPIHAHLKYKATTSPAISRTVRRNKQVSSESTGNHSST